MSLRGNGFRPNKAQFVTGNPIEYILPSSEALPQGAALKQGSTMGGRVGLHTGSGVPDFIGASDIAAGSSATPVPVFRVSANVEFIVPQASSATVVSTTNVGNHVAYCSSGTCLDTGTTGSFIISSVFNTSGAAAQFFTGYFVGTATTI